MSDRSIPISAEYWEDKGIKDAKDGVLRCSKDNPKKWVHQENRLAYKKAYEQQSTLLLILRE